MKRLLILTLMLIAFKFVNTQKVFSVDYVSQADIKVFFVKYASKTGWKNSSKKSLMY